MDFLDVLKSEHQRMLALITQFENTDEFRIRQRIFKTLRNDFIAHSDEEENVVYPYFKRFPETKQLAEDFVQDHARARSLVKRLEGEFQDRGKLEEGVRELKSELQAHIEREENELFVQVRKLLRRNEREQLGRHMEAYRAGRPRAA